MPRVFDLSSGSESDDEHGLPVDGGALAGTPRKRPRIKPSALEKAWVRNVVTAALFVVVVASIAFLVFYLRPGTSREDTSGNPGSNPNSAHIVGSTGEELGPPLKDLNPGSATPTGGR